MGAKKEARLLSWARIGLAPILVLGCYQFAWLAWRRLNCSIFLTIAQAAGISVERLSDVTFASMGRLLRWDIACTGLDAFAGSVPLLWETERSIGWNVGFFAAYFMGLMAANQARLVLGMWLYESGVPWWLSHEALAGVCYFALFLWIARRRVWKASTIFEHWGEPARRPAADQEVRPT